MRWPPPVAGTLLITMPSASGDAVRNVIDAAWKLDLDVRTIPSMSDLLDGSVDLRRVRRVRVEDLLRRPVVAEHAAGVEEIVSDRVVMVTGAPGSMGSELAPQIYALGPRRLVLVDRAESAWIRLEVAVAVDPADQPQEAERLELEDARGFDRLVGLAT